MDWLTTLICIAHICGPRWFDIAVALVGLLVIALWVIVSEHRAKGQRRKS
jgi:hypothetical protein